MTQSEHPRKDLLATTTHARLRASQGDVATARRILESVLAARPDDREASALLGSLEHTRGTLHSEPNGDLERPPQPSAAAELFAQFRRKLSSPPRSKGGLEGRLVDLLARIEDTRRRERA